MMKKSNATKYFLLAASLACSPFQFAKAQAPKAFGESELCSVNAPSLISTALGSWKGTQRKWNAEGELQRTLLSEFTIELVPGAIGNSPAVRTLATYRLPQGNQISQNDFALTCDATSGVWNASIVGFGDIQVTPLTSTSALHVVSAKTDAGLMRSVSLWDFSAPGKWVLTTTWYLNDMVTVNTVNQMARQ